MSDCCSACGGEALKGSRAAASDISVFLKTYLTRRLEEEGIEADLDSDIGCSKLVLKPIPPISRKMNASMAQQPIPLLISNRSFQRVAIL